LVNTREFKEFKAAFNYQMDHVCLDSLAYASPWLSGGQKGPCDRTKQWGGASICGYGNRIAVIKLQGAKEAIIIAPDPSESPGAPFRFRCSRQDHKTNFKSWPQQHDFTPNFYLDKESLIALLDQGSLGKFQNRKVAQFWLLRWGAGPRVRSIGPSFCGITEQSRPKTRR
jgi:hypothetical protein